MELLMKIFLIIIIVIAVIVIAILFFMFFGMGAIKKLIIKEIDFKNISDGNYKGSYHKGRWNYDLELTVKNHKVTEVKNINKQMATFEEFNKNLTSALLEKQKIPFDTVSGATVHTKAFLKAVENAVNKTK